jgi:hypothetical protein
MLLVSIITGALAVLPLILIVINFFRSEKLLKDTKKEINEYSDKLNNIETRYSETIKLLEQKNNDAMGGVLFTQGNLHLNNNKEIAFSSFLRALDYFTMANNEVNVDKSIDMLMEICRETTTLKIKPSDMYFSILDHIISWMNEDIRKNKYADDISFLNNLKEFKNKEESD